MSTLRILHVDDEPDIRELVQISLGLDQELAVKSCDSGRDALSAAEVWSPDLILMDVMMPVMDGPQTLGRLRERRTTADIPVVFMTARAQPRELTHFLSLGAVGVIPKPFDPIALAGAVRQYLRTSVLGLDELRRKFLTRARSDAEMLDEWRARPVKNTEADFEQIEQVALSLAEAPGSDSVAAVKAAAMIVARAAADARIGIGSLSEVEEMIAALLTAVAAGERGEERSAS